jgi:hypothetical protein
MTRRKLYAAATALAASIAGIWWSASPGRVSRINYNRVRLYESTFEQVKSLLGPPDMARPDGNNPEMIVYEQWGSRITVHFNHGRVQAKIYNRATLADWARHLWRRAFGRPAPF